MVWGIEVEADDVADFLDEERVIGDLEMPLAMRLHSFRDGGTGALL